MSTKKGQVIKEGSKYYAKVGTQMLELQTGPMGPEKSLQSLVGQTVQVVVSDPVAVAIFPYKPKPPIACFMHCFICYYPLPFYRQWELDPIISDKLLDVYVKEGWIEKPAVDAIKAARTNMPG